MPGMVGPVRIVAVTDAAGPVGQRLSALLRVAGVEGPIRLDVSDAPHERPAVDSALGADAVVHLAWQEADRRSGAGASGSPPTANLEATRRVLAVASACDVAMLVYLSSAAVYGAWPDNPVPLTEEAVLRPNPGAGEAIARAEAERLIARWADDRPECTVAVLRTAPVVGPGVGAWSTRVMAGKTGAFLSPGDTPRQFVHVDDVAGAVGFALAHRLRGIFNLAPDGWVPASVVRDITGRSPVAFMPPSVARFALRATSAAGLGDLGPEALAFVEHPWVVANDRLRAAGWEPRFSNEEALVAGRPGSWWREMSSGRRQRLAVVAGSVAVAATGALGAAAWRRWPR